ncbi:MAG: hypothetical protein QMD06_03310, partial [Candidatus Altarchaeum sp.]|nr:hypothetical protein [Candidatus Altarchaeum sp.]
MDIEERQYFEKFLDEISGAGTLTKENVRKTFRELKDSVNELSDEVLFNKILMFLEKKIDEDESLSMAQKDTKLISLKIKIFKKNPNTEKYKLVYGYMTTIAAETCGNFFVQSDKSSDYIGIELEKGNLIAKKGGNFVGMNMSSESIHILENTGMFAGQRMSGGNIKIDGTAGVCLGDGIRGGKIEAKMADKTANRSENISVEKYTENYSLQKIQGISLINNYDIERYAKEALKNINEWEKRNAMTKKEIAGTLNNIDASKKVSEEVNKETNSLKFEKVKQKTGNLTHNFNEKNEEQNNKILLSNIMQEIYGKIDVEKIEGIGYVRESERNINRNECFDKIFVTGQKEEEKDRYMDENFERLKLLFEYKEANKEEILTINLSINDIEKILNNITPLTLLEKTIIGYLTSVATEKLAIRGEALVIEKNFDYIGIEMKNGKILVKNAGNYIGKNMYDGEIKVEGNTLGNVGENMVGGKIEITGDVYGDYVGWRMEGGEILIKGACRNFIGLRMLDGKITVEKSAGNGIGERMEGGEILIGGRCGLVGKGMKKGIIR